VAEITPAQSLDAGLQGTQPYSGLPVFRKAGIDITVHLLQTAPSCLEKATDMPDALRIGILPLHHSGNKPIKNYANKLRSSKLFLP
jgi:hypothetical protein